jgi:hypothetical protein
MRSGYRRTLSVSKERRGREKEKKKKKRTSEFRRPCRSRRARSGSQARSTKRQHQPSDEEVSLSVLFYAISSPSPLNLSLLFPSHSHIRQRLSSLRLLVDLLLNLVRLLRLCLHIFVIPGAKSGNFLTERLDFAGEFEDLREATGVSYRGTTSSLAEEREEKKERRTKANVFPSVDIVRSGNDLVNSLNLTLLISISSGSPLCSKLWSSLTVSSSR